MEKSNFVKTAGKLGHLSWYGIVLVGGLLLFSYLFESWSYVYQGNIDRKVETERLTLIAEEMQRPKKEILSYNSVFPYYPSDATSFSLGEQIKFVSDRRIYDFAEDDERKFVSLGGTDIMYCDVDDGGGLGRTKYSYEWIQFNPILGHFTSNPREWDSGTPENPSGNPIPAHCMIQVSAEVCYKYLDEDICRKQNMRSDNFIIE